VDRVLIASRAVWFYAGKLAWPADLMFSYARWTIHASDPLAYVWLVAGAVCCAVVWRVRRFVGRSVETALIFFVVTLAPLLGFIMLYTFRYSFVADHYQYVASLGPLALAAAGIHLGLNRFWKGGPAAGRLFCGVLLVILGTLTWRQCGMYRDGETLWRATLARNPNSYLAHNSLGKMLEQGGRLEEARDEFEKAAAVQTDNAEARNNLGTVLVKMGRREEAIAEFQKAAETQPDFAAAYYNLGTVYAQSGRLDEAIAQLQKAIKMVPGYVDAHSNLGSALLLSGRFREAVLEYESALALQPDNAQLLNNLAWVLATCPEASVRNGARAVELAERAERLSGDEDPRVFETLAAALAETGRFPEALAAARRGLELATARNAAGWASRIQAQIRQYESGTPLRSGAGAKPSRSALPSDASPR
jgi:Flp pilus assembly protein TadD